MALRLEHEDDIEIVRQAALILERENKRLVEKSGELTRRLLQAEGRDQAALQLEIARLEAQFATVKRAPFFGSSASCTRSRGSAPLDRPATSCGGSSETNAHARSLRCSSGSARPAPRIQRSLG